MPLFWSCLNTPPDSFEFVKVTEHSLNILQTFFAQDHENAVVEFANGLSVDDSGSVGEVFEPPIGKEDLIFPEIGIFDVELVGHLSQLLLREVLESLLSAADPAELVIEVQSTNVVDELDVGLISHHGNATV